MCDGIVSDYSLLVTFDLYLVVYTPNGKMIQLDAVQTTKSGRAVKPVVAWYTGQSVSIDPDTNSYVIKYRTQSAESFHKNMAELFKVSVRFRQMSLFQVELAIEQKNCVCVTLYFCMLTPISLILYPNQFNCLPRSV